MNIIKITPLSGEHSTFKNEDIASFLAQHLDQFGDEQTDILKAIDYALNPAKGGFVLLALFDEKIAGALVLNATGMEGYIPSNILVYVAVHKELRGKGIGKQLVAETIANTRGGLALHVEPDNPAKGLYEKMGFTNKYLEMRFQQN